MSGTSSFSFHCQEGEVVAALWIQPHAVPSSLGATRPRAFAQVPSLNSWLGMGEPEKKPQSHTQPTRTKAMFHHSYAPTWVKGSRYGTRRAKIHCQKLMKCSSFCVLSDVGLLWIFETCLFYFLSCLKSQSFPFAFSKAPSGFVHSFGLTIFNLGLWNDFGTTGQITCQTGGFVIKLGFNHLKRRRNNFLTLCNPYVHMSIFHLLDFMFWRVLLKVKWPNWIMIVYKNHILSLCRSQNLSSSAPCYQKFQDQNINWWSVTSSVEWCIPKWVWILTWISV